MFMNVDTRVIVTRVIRGFGLGERCGQWPVRSSVREGIRYVMESGSHVEDIVIFEFVSRQGSRYCGPKLTDSEE